METIFSVATVVSGLIFAIIALATFQYAGSHGPEWLVEDDRGGVSAFIIISGIFTILSDIIVVIMVLVEING